MPGHRHNAGALKQKNKAHGGSGGHSSKRSLKRAQGGKVNAQTVVSTGTRGTTINGMNSGGKLKRLQETKQLRKQKKAKDFLERRTGTNLGAPKIILLMPMGPSADEINLSYEILKVADRTSLHNNNSNNESFIASFENLKTRIHIITAPLSFGSFELLNISKSADVIVPIFSAQDGDNSVSEQGLQRVALLRAHGMPSVVGCLQHTTTLSIKAAGEFKRMASKFMTDEFGEHSKLIATNPHQALISTSRQEKKDTEGDMAGGGNNLKPTGVDMSSFLRTLCQMPLRSLVWRDLRSYMLASDLSLLQKKDFIDQQVDVNNNEEEPVLAVSGYLRGAPLNVDQLIHVPGIGARRIFKILSTSDPCPLKIPRSQGKAAEEGGNVDVLAVGNLKRGDPLRLWATPNSLIGEQTWPNMSEYEDENGMNGMDEDENHKKKLPAGVSEYQSVWMGGSDNEDDDNGGVSLGSAAGRLMMEQAREEEDDDDEEEEDSSNYGFSISFGSVPDAMSENESGDEVKINFGFENCSSESDDDDDEPPLPPVSPPDKLPKQPTPVIQGKVSAAAAPAMQDIMTRPRGLSTSAVEIKPSQRRSRNASDELGLTNKHQGSQHKIRQGPVVGSAPVIGSSLKQQPGQAKNHRSMKSSQVLQVTQKAEPAQLPHIPPEQLPLALGMGHNNCFMNVVVQSFWYLPYCCDKLTSMNIPEIGIETNQDEASDNGADDDDHENRLSPKLTEERELCIALKEVLVGLGKRELKTAELSMNSQSTIPSQEVPNQAAASSTTSKKRRKKKSKSPNQNNETVSRVVAQEGNRVVEVERLRSALVSVASKESKMRASTTGLATLGAMADAVDALGIVLHSLRKVMGDNLVDTLFTIRMREEYVCSHCAANNKVNESSADDVLTTSISPTTQSTILSSDELMKMTGRLSPKLDLEHIIEDKNSSDVEAGVVRVVGHDAPALSIVVPCLKHAAASITALSSKSSSSSHQNNHQFDAILSKASEMSCDVVYCKQSSQCKSRPLPCKRSLRESPTLSSNPSNVCRAPAIFTLELIHDNLHTRSDPVDIAHVLNIIQPKINLNKVFQGKKLEKDKLIAKLRCFFCFQPHRHHYVVYCFDDTHQLWFRFDDNKVAPVGRTYQDVSAVASAGSFMPHVLFYEVDQV